MTQFLRVHSACLCFVLALLTANSAKLSYAQNFVGRDASLVTAAEQARVQSALFWTNQHLPGEWSTPCPIEVTTTSGPATGRTCFQFANGEVFNWSMTIGGEHSDLLRDVIPHEVDHMVRATLVRKPIVRWLDEGCACLFESTSSKEKLRQIAFAADLSQLNQHWLTNQNYPSTAQQAWELYACGFALVEYLLTISDAATLLELQHAQPSLPVAFERLYGFPLANLPQHWSANRSKQPRDGLPSVSSPRPLLTVWTASWCAPCQQFHRDFEQDADFQQRLLSTFQIRILDVDLHAELARTHEINALPTFETATSRWTGYNGRESLLSRLAPWIPTSNRSEVLTPSPAIIPVPKSVNDSQSKSSSENTAAPNGSQPLVASRDTSSVKELWSLLLPVVTSAFPLAGILGGTVLTGGLGGIGLTLLLSWLRRPRTPRPVNSLELPKGGAPDLRLPFPRELDEARELLQLRQSEGRVAVLDALRGMFLDDELERLQQSTASEQQAVARQLKAAIDQRIDEVAPLSTTLHN